MPRYARAARKAYDEAKVKFICTVWKDIQKNATGKHVVENATLVLLCLVYVNSRGSWVVGKDIKKIIGSYKQNRSYGLWPWLDAKGAGVIQESGKFPNTRYKVKDEFYETLCMVVGVSAKHRARKK